MNIVRAAKGLDPWQFPDKESGQPVGSQPLDHLAQLFGVTQRAVNRAVARAMIENRDPLYCKIPGCTRVIDFYKGNSGGLHGSLCIYHRKERDHEYHQNRNQRLRA